MLRIKRIKIRNFRSIVDLDIKVDKMNILVGLNDVGKSNVLKALNLFFNGETEPGVGYNFETDYSKYAPVRKKKAKEIVITITFAIPQRYSYHEDVVWTKVWREGGLHTDNSSKWNFTPYSKVPTLFKRISYKYVPAIKSDNYFKLLLADLYMSIAKEANNELVEKSKAYSAALDGFTQSIGARVHRTVGIESNLIMPTNQVDIFKELVFQTHDNSGESIALSYRGDGIKAIHIPAILKYIAEQDNRLMSNTAVPITPIWGYEEPENGIEMRKCFDLAKELFGFSNDIQEFITTHSLAFYQLGGEKNVNVFYVYKDQKDFSSQIRENLDYVDLHDKIGLMPIIAPIVAEKQAEIEAMNELLGKSKFIDRETIFVEGITDKQYLKMAIETYSEKLNDKLEQGQLQIVTNEENGCGTRMLVDWAIAWIHLNYNSKAVVLLDADKAGRDAKRRIDEEKALINKNHKIKAILLQETDDIKLVNSKIKNHLNFTIEHLLSYDFGRKLRANNWVSERSQKDLIDMFFNVLDISKPLNETICEMVDNIDLRDSIVMFSPKSDKKTQILNMVKKEIEEGDVSILEGFKPTIERLEVEFCNSNS